MALTRDETETIIRFDETDRPAVVYTSSKRVAGHLTRRGLVPAKTDASQGDEVGWTFLLPKHSVTLKPGRNIIRVGGRP